MKTPRACPPTPDGQTRGVPAFSARLATPQSKPRYFRRQRASTDPPTKPSYATVPTQLQPLPTTSQSRGHGGPRHCNAVTDTFRDLVARAALPAAPPPPPPESKEARRAQLCVFTFSLGAEPALSDAEGGHPCRPLRRRNFAFSTSRWVHTSGFVPSGRHLQCFDRILPVSTTARWHGVYRYERVAMRFVSRWRVYCRFELPTDC